MASDRDVLKFGVQPAFPVANAAQDGLTKWEFFAGLAMLGLLAEGARLTLDPEDVAGCAAGYASAMIVEAAEQGEWMAERVGEK